MSLPSLPVVAPPRAPLPRLAHALRETLAEGYGKRHLRADLVAGLVVGIIALPLSMALAIAAGMPPHTGVYTAIAAGTVSALAGGSRVQISGPTAAFVVLLAPITAQYGPAGLLTCTVMAGLVLVGLAVARVGRLIAMVPSPVVTGFTAGIAVVIAVLQVKDFAGLTVAGHAEHFTDRLGTLVLALPTVRGPDLGVGALTLAVLLFWPRITARVPAPLVALGLATAVGVTLTHLAPAIAPVTIGERYGALPAGLPGLRWPWTPGEGFGPPLELSWELLQALMPSALAIAFLGAMESLLSAVIADGTTGQQHDPDAELLGQGLGNLVAPFFGGFAATGALARTATNIRYGGISPFSATFHAVFLTLVLLFLSGPLSWLPLSSLAALLFIVAWNMSEARHFVHMLRVSPRHDKLVLVSCFLLTVFFDMVIAVTLGVLMASMLFMRRMVQVSNVRLVQETHLDHGPLPPGVLLFEVAGPLFFGAAQRAMSTIRVVDPATRAVLIDLSAVPIMDATALVNLESALERLHHAGVLIRFIGAGDQPRELLEKSGLADVHSLCRDLPEALARLDAPGEAEAPGAAIP